MLFSSRSLRQRIVTLRACVEKNSAACPAELPAPTMWTSSPCVWGASLRAATTLTPTGTRQGLFVEVTDSYGTRGWVSVEDLR